MRSFFRLILLALVLLVVALVSALTAMRLAIHRQEVAVPNLVGTSPAAARMVAEQSGMELTVERQYYSPTIPEGKILSQLPPAGSQVRRGWQVRVAESLGPQRVDVPETVGKDERLAALTLRRAGMEVPADVSVVGFDDSGWLNCTDPPLTTVRQPIESMGKAAVALLVNQMESLTVQPEELLFEPELVVRGSTGPAPVRTLKAADVS